MLKLQTASEVTVCLEFSRVPFGSFEGSIPFSVAVTAHDGAVDSTTVSHDATLTVNPLPETPVYSTATPIINNHTTSADTISFSNLAELTEDGTDTVTVKITGLHHLPKNGNALLANPDGSFTLIFFFNDTATTEIYPLSLHDALPICSIPFSVAVTAHDGAVDSTTVSHDATLTVNPLPETP